MSKKYFWLKLKDNFFHDIKIKKLRRIAGGDTYTIIYQKILLLSISNGGVVKFEGVEDTLAEELSLILDESETNVDMTLAYMSKYNLIEQIHDDEFLLTDAPLLIGSESDSAERVRKLRAKKKQDSLIESNTDQEALQCNNGVTQRREEKELEKRKIIEDIELDFSEFWKHYPKKKSKETAKKAFKKFYKIMPPLEDMINHLCMMAVTKDWTKENGKFIPYPATWLNAHGWEDEVSLSKQDKYEAVRKQLGLTNTEMYERGLHG